MATARYFHLNAEPRQVLCFSISSTQLDTTSAISCWLIVGFQLGVLPRPFSATKHWGRTWKLGLLANALNIQANPAKNLPAVVLIKSHFTALKCYHIYRDTQFGCSAMPKDYWLPADLKAPSWSKQWEK